MVLIASLEPCYTVAEEVALIDALYAAIYPTAYNAKHIDHSLFSKATRNFVSNRSPQ